MSYFLSQIISNLVAPAIILIIFLFVFAIVNASLKHRERMAQIKMGYSCGECKHIAKKDYIEHRNDNNYN